MIRESRYYNLLKRKDQRKALEDCLRDTGSMRGKKVLEIGSDWDGLMLRIMREDLGAWDCIGVNPELDHMVKEDGFRLLPIDGANTPLPNESVDLVFSHATLEHVLDLDTLLVEMHRVLKNHGRAWLSFGPIWSSSKGHHLWVKHKKEKYTFTENNPIPDYAHLLWSDNKLKDHLLRQGLEYDLAEMICYQVYRAPVINRLFYEDYIKIFSNSRLSICHIKKERDSWINIVKRKMRYLPMTFQLAYKYPFQDLNTYGAVVVLEKRS